MFIKNLNKLLNKISTQDCDAFECKTTYIIFKNDKQIGGSTKRTCKMKTKKDCFQYWPLKKNNNLRKVKCTKKFMKHVNKKTMRVI